MGSRSKYCKYFNWRTKGDPKGDPAGPDTEFVLPPKKLILGKRKGRHRRYRRIK